MIIVSAGTGAVKKKYDYENLKHAGEAKWYEPMLDILLSCNSETVAYELSQIFGTLTPENQQNYYRLEADLKNVSFEIDEATYENISNLHYAGLTFIQNNTPMLKEIAQKILEND